MAEGRREKGGSRKFHKLKNSLSLFYDQQTHHNRKIE